MIREKIEAIAKRSGNNVRTLICEMSDEIAAAIEAAAEQAQQDDKGTFTVTLAHSIKLDMGADTQEDSLAVSVRHKVAIKGDLPDPNQPELFEEDAA